MEWVWRPFYSHIGNRSEIFTHTFYDYYYSPKGFIYDQKRNDDEPVIDDITLKTFNADKKAQLMLDYVMKLKAAYRTNHYFIPIGGDFFFGNARITFGSIDNLIKYFNSHVEGITLLYSTPSEYIDAVTAVQGTVWPTK